MTGFLQENKKKIFFIADAIIIALSVYLAFFARFEGKIPGQYDIIILRMILLGWVFYLPGFYFHKLYSFSWSYVGFQDLLALFRSTALSFMAMVAVFFTFQSYQFFSGFPRSTMLIGYFLVFLGVGGLRFAKRFYLQLFKKDSIADKEMALIVGAGDAGEQIARSIVNSRHSSYFAAGFVDDNKTKWGNLIHGIKVFGSIEKIPGLVKELSITEMIIALPTAGSKIIRRAVELGRNAGLKKIKVIPSIHEIIGGNISLANIREVEVEDLLERDPVTLDTGTIEKFIFRRKVAITGAAGSIGSEICRQVAKFNPAFLLIIDQDETGIFNVSRELKKNFPNLKTAAFVADICDALKIEKIFSDNRPEIIFHAAAYKHVPLMESHPDEAVKNNIFGTRIVAQAAINADAEKFIFISTDKAVNPTSVMGVSKRIGEMICQSFNQKNHTRFVSVRFGNVLNSRGSVIPIFREQIKMGGPVEVTHPDMTRYFMLISEACLLVMQAGAMGQGGEVFVLDMGRPVKIMDLAQEMIRLSGSMPPPAIVWTGIRPGEKIFEEMLTVKEGNMATENNKIFIAKLEAVNLERLSGDLDVLRQALAGNDRREIKALFKKIVLEYSGAID